MVEREFCFFDRPAQLRLLLEGEEFGVARFAELDLEHEEAGLCEVVGIGGRLGLLDDVGAECPLLLDELVDQRLELVELVGGNRGRATDDQRGGLVDEDESTSSTIANECGRWTFVSFCWAIPLSRR